MDKKTMGVVAACMLLLFLWGPLVNKIWPPIKVVEPAGTTAPTNGSPASDIASMAAAPPSTNEVARSALTSATPAPTMRPYS